ncbi:hypothetical protein K5N55_003884 [Vibrio vulnificus]|nr:hypothetical protein [Vibrio vulnificus]MCU8194267.1 hypothetical protein [Vibrio vulnificus]HAS6231094.1 hypothetical protein [Vibrio vulnificus]HDY7776826.1 hypothetical protein [Vibrio vulnificus]
MNKLKSLHTLLKTTIPTLAVSAVYDESNSVGITFEYLGKTYSVYINAESQSGALLAHDQENLADVQEMGTVTVEALTAFFETLPKLENILK